MRRPPDPQTSRSSETFWVADAGAAITTPVAKPLLPAADAILPHLRRLDANRWYSNGGPLQLEFESGLSAAAGGAGVTTVANATVGLALALMAQEAPSGSLCMMPAWSFAASAHAARMAGLVPWLVDVDPESWALQPDAAAALLGTAPGPVGAVMPVMPFGSPMDPAAWDGFRNATGVAVAIDAAAAFDTIRASAVPSVVSLHATKILGIGEGGFVASNDSALIDDIRRRSNFGFWHSREAAVPAFNGKISEYASAVGLAALDAWPQTRAAFQRVAAAYRAAFAACPDVAFQAGFGEGWVSCTVIVRLPEGTLPCVMSALAEAGIGMRRWWGGGLHRHGAFHDCPRTALPVTERLVGTVVGLPCWADLPDAVVGRIADLVRAALAGAGSRDGGRVR